MGAVNIHLAPVRRRCIEPHEPGPLIHMIHMPDVQAPLKVGLVTAPSLQLEQRVVGIRRPFSSLR